MLDIPPAFGRQTYRIQDGAARIAQTVHQLRPEPGETGAEFLARVLADALRVSACDAEFTLHWRDRRITSAEITLSPAQPQNPPTH